MNNENAMNRRRIVVGLVGMGATAVLGSMFARRAAATPESAKQLLQTLAKGEPKEGRVALKVP
jgi:hypothetical protein